MFGLLAVLLVCSGVTLVLWRLAFPCDSEERAVLIEFPHFGGKEEGKDFEVLGNDPGRFTLGPGNSNGACVAAFSAAASEDQVLSHYEVKLAEQGWAVERFPVNTEGEFEFAHVDASRGVMRFVVHYGAGGEVIRIRVFKD